MRARRDARQCAGDATTPTCGNMTTHPSGLCHHHRRRSRRATPTGKAAERAERGYANPAAMRAGLMDRAKVASQQDPTYTVDQRLRQYSYTRFADRLFDHQPDRWVVKGGGALLARLPGARHTRDIDLWADGDTVEDGVQAIHEALADASAHGNPDMLEFDVGEWTYGKRHGRTSANATVVARLNNRPLSTFGVDVIAGDPGLHPPDVLDPPRPIDVPGLPENQWRVYAAESHTADKLAACFEEYSGRSSSRFRDLSDLAHISWEEPVDADKLSASLRSEFERRGIELPSRFAVPDEERWREGWGQPLTKARVFDDVSFDDAVDRVRSFLDPVLDGSARGRWNPDLGVWSD